MKPFQLTTLLLMALFSALSLYNCGQKDFNDLPYKYQAQGLDLPEEPYNYNTPDLPNHMFFAKQALIDKGISNKVATLGRVLFYEPKLSLTNNVACASCHKQEFGFADPVAFSTGFDGGKTARNASTIINPIEQNALFWDARETDIKQMVMMPIKHSVEMGLDNFEAMERKLSALDYYKQLFKEAFGDDQITRERIAESLSQFVLSMVSGRSKFDEADPNGWGVTNTLVFNDQELEGLNLFFGVARCANCHNPSNSFFGFPNFSESWADIGLETVYEDKGVGENTPGMEGMFKIPSLRNVALTAPYMHDGRFATLMDVVNHYNENIKASGNLHWTLQDGAQPAKLGLNQEQKEALVAFLKTLTDQQFLNDPKFSSPFK